MKKCPKCGTVLDDSKKKCYMCGADLQKNKTASFGDSFNSQIGATMSIGQDNVFNNTNNINANLNDVNKYSKNTNNEFSSSKNMFQNELDGLNSLKYDNRSKLEKIFDSDSKKNSKKETVIKNTGSVNSLNNTGKAKVSSPSKEEIFSTPDPVSKERTSAPINWGDNLNNKKQQRRTKQKKEVGFSFNMLLNFICFFICIGGILFVYFKFIKEKDSNEYISFGGLNYQINNNFILKTDDNFSRYYTFGDNCAVRINYGSATNPDTFIENYFNKVKDTYANQEGYTTSTQILSINDNKWSELSVQGLKENASAPGGFSFYSKYKHIAIVYKGNYYDIVYANTEDDTTCSGMYDTLIESFYFD